METLLRTDPANRILLVQRIVLALVIAPHGAQKLLGWFGGGGFSETMEFFTGAMDIPAPIAFLVVVGESAGALLLAVGLFARVAAFGITAIMLGAIALSHAEFGFFMNWFGQKQGEGFEFHLLALGLSVPLLLWGGGARALDTQVLARLGINRRSSP